MVLCKAYLSVTLLRTAEEIEASYFSLSKEGANIVKLSKI